MKSLHTKNIKTYGQHLLILAVLSFFIPLNVSASGRESGKEAQDTTIASTKTKTKTSARKIFNGYGGGMMLCGSYLFGTIPQVGYNASGPAFGIGGQLRVGLGKHFRIGSEGYVTTAGRMKNGSYLRTGWGGVLGDFCWRLKKVIPYVGVTIGGGGRTTFLMYEGNKNDWEAEDKTIFNKQTFFAITPFVGCEIIISKAFHINIKADCLNAISSGRLISPTGPSLYVGFSFTH